MDPTAISRPPYVIIILYNKIILSRVLVTKDANLDR
jgi:hypothetical protein